MENKFSLLSDTEAAIYLGITKELLFSYIRNAPKGYKGDTRKLSSTVIDGQNYFEKSELIDFDSYLKEPWSESAAQRPPIPSYIKDYLKVEIQGKCPITGSGYPLEDAHIIPYSKSLNHHHHNIIRISGNLHTKIDNGLISIDILKKKKDELIEELRNKISNKIDSNKSYFKPPKPHPLYIGRLNELDKLVEAMETEKLIILEGLGGIGKTQLLLQAFDNVQYNQPVIWIDIESIKTFLDFTSLFNNSIQEYFHINASSGSQMNGLEYIQVTFVFDSLEKLLIDYYDETCDFLNELLLKASNIQIIITSQIDLSLLDYPSKIFKIKGLMPEESIALIYEFLNDEFDIQNDDLCWILDFCNGHPLSLKLITTLIRYYKSSERMIEQLKNNQKNIAHPNRKKHNKQTSLSTCLDTIYNTLNPQQKEILHFLMYYPGGLQLKWIKHKYGDDLYRKHLAELLQFFFLEKIEDSLNIERLIISNPIRPFLREKIKSEGAKANLDLEKEAISITMSEAVLTDGYYIESNLQDHHPYGFMRMDNEMPNLLLAFSIAKERSNDYEKLNEVEIRNEYLEIISGISDALGIFCFTKSDYEKGLWFSKLGIDANIKLKDYHSACTQYMYLAQIQSRLLDTEGLKETANQINDLANLTLDDSISLYAIWTNGHLSFLLEKYDNARNDFIKAINLLENLMKRNNEFVKSDIGNLMILKLDLAKTYEFQKEYFKAIPIYKEILDSQQEKLRFLGESNLGSVYHHYAHCLCKTGNLEEGVKYYYLSIDNFLEVGQFEYIANSIMDLGEFVEDSPEIINYSTLNDKVLLRSLESINNLLLNTPVLDGNIDNIPTEFISKILWMIKAISFSNYSFVLYNWVANLLNEISIDLSRVNYLGALLNLAHCIGGVEEWKKNSEANPIMMNSILKCCLIINGGPDLKSKTRIFYWLAKWQKHTELQNDSTAESLWGQAWNLFPKDSFER